MQGALGTAGSYDDKCRWPSGLIELQNCMRGRRDVNGDLFQMYVHASLLHLGMTMIDAGPWALMAGLRASLSAV